MAEEKTSIEQFSFWRTDDLKDYLRKRGLPICKTRQVNELFIIPMY